jgi:predicted nucleotidyltransferase
MSSIPLKQIKRVLSDNKDVAFAYIFGSSAGKTEICDNSDLDMAIYFHGKPDYDLIYSLIREMELLVGEDIIDPLILNGCEDFVLRNEVLRGDLIFCRDPDLHAAFFSWTLRMYEDQMLRIKHLNTYNI